jgi:hypothetical protein
MATGNGVDIDGAIEELASCLIRHGWPAPRPPEDLDALYRLTAEIAPLGLPADVRRFWERVAPETIAARPSPTWQGPDAALSSWMQDRDDFKDAHPLALLEIGYTSHECMSVELEVDDEAGGALYQWNLVGTHFNRCFASIGDWIAHVCRVMDRGLSERVDGRQGPFLLVPGPDHEREGAPPELERIPRSVYRWPDSWRRAQ